MDRKELIDQIKQKSSFLCVGLDTDLNKIPTHLLKEKDPVFEFNKQIIDATQEYCIAYKPNIAFYESLGKKGWESLEKTMELIPKNIFSIADAKRGDIGNTSKMYAKAFFDKESSGFEFDSITIAPYMGSDSVMPFLEFKNKWAILLALTSNQGSEDFQKLNIENKYKLYEEVIIKSRNWGTDENLMYVIGATKAEYMIGIRKLIPNHFLLVPGVGAQGGSLQDVAKFGMNKDCGLIVNSSRGIIYKSANKDFAKKAAEESKKIRDEMKILLDRYS